MGKGDKRSKRGKIHNGTYGARRKKKQAAKKTTKRPAK
jgi:ribosomal small subunit protein bTHX